MTEVRIFLTTEVRVFSFRLLLGSIGTNKPAHSPLELQLRIDCLQSNVGTHLQICLNWPLEAHMK